MLMKSGATAQALSHYFGTWAWEFALCSQTELERAGVATCGRRSHSGAWICRGLLRVPSTHQPPNPSRRGALRLRLPGPASRELAV